MTALERDRFPGGGASGDGPRAGFAPAGRRTARLLAVVAALALAESGLSCSASDSGGMSGTGVSQGSINSFGSIFVNGVEWSTAGARIELDGARASESDLRLGMVVRVDGDFAPGGLSGDARSVRFDDAIEGPIDGAPVETVAGVEKSFVVLGTTVFVRADQTVFGDGASFAGLASDDVVQVSGFLDSSGAVHATRIDRKGSFPAVDRVELRGRVANLGKNADGSGIFDLGSAVIRYSSSTAFSDLTRTTLADGDLVEVEGRLRVSGNDEVDATRVELESSGFGSEDRENAEVEGIVVLCAASLDYCIDGVPIDDGGATFEPPGYVPAAGDRAEVKGSLVAGVLVANRVKSEDSDSAARDVRIDAAATSIDAAARTLVILGVTVTADGGTRLADESQLHDESLSFGELQPGQYLEIEAISTGAATARALSIERRDGAPGNDDVRLEGPVTALDPNAPALSILGQSIPLAGGTVYRDASGQSRTEEEFFRNPGDVVLGDIVRARDAQAASLSALAEADEVGLEGGD